MKEKKPFKVVIKKNKYLPSPEKPAKEIIEGKPAYARGFPPRVTANRVNRIADYINSWGWRV